MKKIFILVLFITSLNLHAQQSIAVTSPSGNVEEIDIPENMTLSIDSLLSNWHAKNYLSISPEDCNYEDVNPTYPDSIYIDRLSRIPTIMEMPYNDIVRKFIDMYSGRLRKSVSYMLGASNFYMPIFEQALDLYNLPYELKYLPIIESALNPTAVSRAGAKGMWQFMYSTAKLYGLTINSFVDERLDPVASAEAAARYLKDSYMIFGDWNLAIASYNCGAGNVNRAIRRSGGKRAFWDIYPYLPRETRGYVPAFVGALYTLRYYKEHGIEPEAVALPPAVDTFKIHKMLHFKQISELVGIPAEEIKNLNPQYRHEIIPGNEKEYILRIPYSYVNGFIDAEDSLYSYKADVYFNPVTLKKIKDGGDGQRIVYRVKSGDVLGKIALRYRVTVSQIKRWNNLRSNTIRIGQRLVIYSGVKPSAEPVQTKKTAATSSSSSKTSVSPEGRYHHRPFPDLLSCCPFDPSAAV